MYFCCIQIYIHMAETSLRISNETKSLLNTIKDKYGISTYDLCVNYLALFILRNDINPKDDFIGDFKSELIQLEKRLSQTMELAHKKITKDNASLRSWVGGITKDHLVPITEKLSFLDKIADLEINKIIAKNFNNSKDLNPLNVDIKKENKESSIHSLKDEEIDKKEEHFKKIYEEYQKQKEALFKIFNHSKIETGGMMSGEKIVINLSVKEWEELKKLK